MSIILCTIHAYMIEWVVFVACYLLLWLLGALVVIEVSCYGYDGIDAVKESLRAGLKQSTEEMPLKVSPRVSWMSYVEHTTI